MFWSSQKYGWSPAFPTVPSPSLWFLHPQTQQLRGGVVCFMVNFLWATDVSVFTTQCYPVLELLTIKVQPFYLPRVQLSPPYSCYQPWISCIGLKMNWRTLTLRPFSLFWEISTEPLKLMLPKYYQHIISPPRGNKHRITATPQSETNPSPALLLAKQITVPFYC